MTAACWAMIAACRATSASSCAIFASRGSTTLSFDHAAIDLSIPLRI